MRLRVALAAVVALVVPAPALGWSWPVDGPVLTLFSFDESTPYAAGQHRGIDIGGPPGAAVVAPASGSVAFAGTVPRQGKVVTIETADGYSVTLVHLGSYSVRRGDPVAEGETVGAVGPSGVAELSVPYVHLGVRRTSDEDGYVDPLSLLPARLPPVSRPPADVAPQPSAPAPQPAPVATQAAAPPSAAGERPPTAPTPAGGPPALDSAAGQHFAKPAASPPVRSAVPVPRPSGEAAAGEDAVRPLRKRAGAVSSRAGRDATPAAEVGIRRHLVRPTMQPGAAESKPRRRLRGCSARARSC